MCRLFGQIDVRPAAAADFLARSPRSLLVLSDADPRKPQGDGWGIAYFNGGARVVKSPKPIFQEKRRFAELAAGLRSRVLIGHIRAASNPNGLAPRRLIGAENTQPFTDGRWAFAHNGTLEIPREVAKFLGSYRKKIRGVNDSEVFFWQLMKFVDAYGSVPEAFKACIRETWGIWKGCRARYPKKKAPYTGLNALLSDGSSLYALSHYPSRPGSRALCGAQPWGTMSLARRGSRLVVASEDMDSGSWQRLPGPQIVSAIIENGRLMVRRQSFKVDG